MEKNTKEDEKEQIAGEKIIGKLYKQLHVQ